MFERKKKNDYFAMMEELSRFSIKACDKLLEELKAFDPAKVDDCRLAVHVIEHQADQAKHIILQKLVKEFITPIERDDIMALIHILDDVTDAIDDVAINLYSYNVQSISESILQMAELTCRCVGSMSEVMKDLRHFKKSARLHKLIVEVNNLESEADDCYIASIRGLYTSDLNPLEITGHRQVLDCLENCCDLCDEVTEVVVNAVMRNS